MPLQRSWVASANAADSHFPLNNLPYGVFSRGGDAPCCGAAIGDQVLDLALLEHKGLIDLADHTVFDLPSWNGFMALGPDVWAALRLQLTALLAENGDSALRDDTELRAHALVPLAEVQLHLPIWVAEYTDFYAGRHHAFNVGSMFRDPANALPPNWLHIPIGYNGRASSVVVSGTDIHRPMGQLKPATEEIPHFGPSRRLDIELEMGAIVGTGTEMGQPITVAEADRRIFGYVLLNDWSARDIQAWEYQPLGPFQAKAFGTSISPWIVTKEALEPFRCATPPREKELLPYLREPGPMLYDIQLEILLRPAGAERATSIARTNYNEMYYSAAQQLCHHAVSGCPMNTGDLLGSGTISGPEKEQRGSLLELTWGGKEPMTLDTGEERSFLEDGDQVTLTGFRPGRWLPGRLRRMYRHHPARRPGALAGVTERSAQPTWGGTMSKAFASQGDLTEKTISFTEIGRDLWAFTAEGDPNSGVIIGDDRVMVVEAQATPRLAQKVIDRIRQVTDKPITHLALTHYHAVRVLGASAYQAEQIIMSDKARAMVVERGQEDWDSEFGRFPRLFEGHESIPGLTWPTTTFSHRMTVYLGQRQVELMHIGRAHTAGDIVIWVPDEQVMFTGDIVEYHSACYCGDGHFGDWGATLDAVRSFNPHAIAPGRGDALVGDDMVQAALDSTGDFVLRPTSRRPRSRPRAGHSKMPGIQSAPRAIRSSRTTPSTSTACRSTSRAPMTRRAVSTRRGSGRRSGIA